MYRFIQVLHFIFLRRMSPEFVHPPNVDPNGIPREWERCGIGKGNISVRDSFVTHFPPRSSSREGRESGKGIPAGFGGESSFPPRPHIPAWVGFAPGPPDGPPPKDSDSGPPAEQPGPPPKVIAQYLKSSVILALIFCIKLTI